MKEKVKVKIFCEFSLNELKQAVNEFLEEHSHIASSNIAVTSSTYETSSGTETSYAYIFQITYYDQHN